MCSELPKTLAINSPSEEMFTGRSNTDSLYKSSLYLNAVLTSIKVSSKNSS